MSKVKYAIGITLFESKKFGGPKICEGAICPTERENKMCCGVIEVMEMADVKIIGQMDNTIDHTFESANRVYDIGGVAPTMNTCGGGGLQPKIIETKCVGGLGEKKSNNGTQYYQQERVYQMGEYSLCLPANLPGGSYNYITDEKVCAAMRGRNPTKPSDRTPRIELEQTLEVNNNGTTNCLTSVQKDNLVLEKNIPCKLDKMPYGHLDSMENARVCDVNTQTSSTVTARYYKGIGAHKDNMVMDRVSIKQATKQGYIECNVGGVADFSYPNSDTRRGRVQADGEICPTITAENQDVCKIETQYRIRKLTPKECWRLMDFSDEDFEKAAEVNSNTQLYKQAGNSIVVNVLVAILGQLLQGKEDLYKEIS